MPTPLVKLLNQNFLPWSSRCCFAFSGWVAWKRNKWSMETNPYYAKNIPKTARSAVPKLRPSMSTYSSTGSSRPIPAAEPPSTMGYKLEIISMFHHTWTASLVLSCHVMCCNALRYQSVGHDPISGLKWVHGNQEPHSQWFHIVPHNAQQLPGCGWPMTHPKSGCNAPVGHNPKFGKWRAKCLNTCKTTSFEISLWSCSGKVPTWFKSPWRHQWIPSGIWQWPINRIPSKGITQ